jgi:hypothetical protein
MSTALGQDLKSSAIQLGKAMNDPITGATALRRVGVALTDQQMEQIKAFQESGDLLSAQKIIMKELAVEFGGSARAAADPMTQLGNTIGELKEQIGIALLPVILAFARVMSANVVPALAAGIKHVGSFIAMVKAFVSGDIGKAADLFATLPGPLQSLALLLAENEEGIRAFASGVRNFVVGLAELIAGFARWLESSGLLDTALTGIKTIAEGIRITMVALAPIVERVAQFFQDHKSAAIALGIALGVVAVALFPIPAAILAVILAVGLLREHWDEIKAKTLDVWQTISDFINERLSFLVTIVRFHFESIKNQITTTIEVIRAVVKTVMALLHGDWSEAWEGIREAALAIWDGLVTDIGLKLGFLRETFEFAWSAIQNVTATAWENIKDAITSRIQSAWDFVRGILRQMLVGIKSATDAIPGPNPAGNALQSGIDALRPGPQVPGGFAPRLQHGTPYVPRDMLAFLHRGEAVIPAALNRGGMGMTVQNMTIVLPNVHEPSDFPRELDRYFRRVA